MGARDVREAADETIARPPWIAGLILMLCVGSGPAGGDADILIADFEGESYGSWKVSGECFGARPARGTLPGQMPVTGFGGKGLVNSFHAGDKSTGTLTSPEFRIERNYIRFLVGGGKDVERTCMRLLVGGRMVRNATGPNERPGGSEEVAVEFWDVRELKGELAVIQIVDQATGGWGHINVDEIVQTNLKPPALLVDASREITLERNFLNLPVRNGGPKRRMRVSIEGQLPRCFEIELADGQPDWWMSIDVAQHRGESVTLGVDKLPEDSPGLSAIDQSDEIKDADTVYRERLRPQFHFSPRRGWTNDPNGLVFYDGEYHLFFQHNPAGVNWGNMTWGHAVSTDLIHWRELEPAIYPDSLGTIYSGSAVVDCNNTAGFQTGAEKVIVCIYTSAGGTSTESPGQRFTQSIAYSNDRGRTWAKYDRNPVLAHVAGENRDPKVFWHAATKQWVMALFLDGHQFALFGSPDLKSWSKLSDIPTFDAAECPDLFELPVDGDAADTRWVFWGGNGNYLVGRFDGTSFVKEAGPLRFEQGSNYYAAQTYSDIPAADGRRIQIAWMNGGRYPGMPFNQQMSFPSVLSLRTFPNGVRLCREPVKEIERIRARRHRFEHVALDAGVDPLKGIESDLLEIHVELAAGEAERLTLNIRGTPVTYDVREESLAFLGKAAKLPPVGGRVSLTILVDRTSLEIFGADGRLSMSSCFLPPADDRRLSLTTTGGVARIERLDVWELQSAWRP